MEIIIIGLGPSHIKCDFKADEIWGINSIADKHPDQHFNKLFAFDVWPLWYTDNMKKHAPIVSWREYADIKYPLKSIQRYFETDYFTNTITYMLALAIYQKVSKIRMFGIDVPYGGKYHQDKSGVEYWLGRAAERGIEIESPLESHLLRTVSGKVYGGEACGKALMSLSDRVILTNLLPQRGHYEDMIKANVIQLLLTPKDVEGEEYKITLRRTSDGRQSYTCPVDFSKEIYFEPHNWAYIADLLKGLHDKEELPLPATGLYEIFVLAPKREL